MTWGEAYRLVLTLAADPSSQFGASLAELERPYSPEYLALWTLAGNHVATHAEEKPKLTKLADPTEKKRRPRARLSVDRLHKIAPMLGQG